MESRLRGPRGKSRSARPLLPSLAVPPGDILHENENGPVLTRSSNPHPHESTNRPVDLLGLEAYSLHAPFTEHLDITSFDAGARETALEQILRAAST